MKNLTVKWSIKFFEKFSMSRRGFWCWGFHDFCFCRSHFDLHGCNQLYEFVLSPALLSQLFFSLFTMAEISKISSKNHEAFCAFQIDKNLIQVHKTFNLNNICYHFELKKILLLVFWIIFYLLWIKKVPQFFLFLDINCRFLS